MGSKTLTMQNSAFWAFYSACMKITQVFFEIYPPAKVLPSSFFCPYACLLKRSLGRATFHRHPVIPACQESFLLMTIAYVFMSFTFQNYVFLSLSRLE